MGDKNYFKYKYSRPAPFENAEYLNFSELTEATQLHADKACDELTFFNHGTADIYIGFSDEVAADKGTILKPGGSWDLPVKNCNKIWLAAGSGTVALNVTVKQYGEE